MYCTRLLANCVELIYRIFKKLKNILCKINQLFIIDTYIYTEPHDSILTINCHNRKLYYHPGYCGYVVTYFRYGKLKISIY